ncbi:TIGR03960 family B12-binding radical SAM protein [Caldanaerobius fijiensis]|nr:TIGR03960 family B12-binding radical SAM protein [Caldanaerobius fijiensis]
MKPMRNDIKKFLLDVEKPSRYTGNEINSVHKDPGTVEVRFAFAFPDVYDIGMSHLGMKILYHMLNDRSDVYCERVFAPWPDMENIMRRENIPLFALESGDNIAAFDFIGFTLQYELSYTNIINMLDLAGIPLYSSDRDINDPFVIAGGPCVYNPEPMADVFDFFVIGEAEESLIEIIECYKNWKKSGSNRREFLEKVAQIRGIYVPSLYDVIYKEDGTVDRFIPKGPYPMPINKRIIKDLDKAYYPDKMVIPYTEVVHDRIMLEIFRGCTHGCRFCQAGMIYRPIREKSVNKLIELADKLVSSTGYDDISLVSLSSCDYSQIQLLIAALIEKYKNRGIGVSLPSIRIDTFSVDLLEQIEKVRKTGLTFAPEAGTQRLRDVINKGVTEQDLIESARAAFEHGWSTLKLYFMIGLPTETMEDIKGIADLAYRLVDLYKEIKGSKKGLKITVSTSSFVPKPFTPFQWEPQDTMEQLKEKQDYLKSLLKDRSISYNWHDNKASFLEAVISRGDRKICKVIIRAWKNGCKFDSWGDFLNFDGWLKAFDEENVDPKFYAYRKRDYQEFFPWDIINPGIDKAYLIREHQKAQKGITTIDCREYCLNCGIKKLEEGLCK